MADRVEAEVAAAVEAPPNQPSVRPSLLTTDNDYLLAEPSLPVGARLMVFSPAWHQITSDGWVLDCVDNGLRIPFFSHPPLTSSPTWTKIPANPLKAKALRTEVLSLLQKSAVESLHPPYPPGFFSKIFLVPKSGDRWRPVIDLSALNRFIIPPPPPSRWRLYTMFGIPFNQETGRRASTWPTPTFTSRCIAPPDVTCVLQSTMWFTASGLFPSVSTQLPGPSPGLWTQS